MVVLLQELVFALGCFVGDDFPADAEFGSALLLCEIVESLDLGFFLLNSRGHGDKTLRLGTTQ